MLSGEVPRPLRPKERELIDSVLPPDRPGYEEIRRRIDSMVVIDEGRRGEGTLTLGGADAGPDAAGALTPVIAFGAVETTRDLFTISIREPAGGQIDVEIVSDSGGSIPDHFEEKRRWAYSDWRPGRPSPATAGAVREIALDEARVFALCAGDRRLWLYDGVTGIVHLIPVTGFHNELMMVKKIRDPRHALESGLLFDQSELWSDAELRSAFVRYNTMRPRVSLESAAGGKPAGWRDAVRELFTRRSRHVRQ